MPICAVRRHPDSRGAHVKAVRHDHGHSSNSDLNTYSHQFPDTMERFVDGLEETFREAETAFLDGLNSLQGFST